MFLDHLKQLYDLKKTRNKSFDKFLKMGLPDKSWEAFQYVSLNELYEQRFSLPDANRQIAREEATLVFVNGVFKKELSSLDKFPRELLIMPLRQAEMKFGPLLLGRVDDKDPFSLLNHAFCEEGLFVYVPANLAVEVPVKILNVYEGGGLFSPRVHLFLGKGSQLELCLDERQGQGHGQGHGWINFGMDVLLEEGSSLNCISILEKREMFHTESFCFDLKKNSSLKHTTMGFGKKIFRQNFRVNLAREANASLAGAFKLERKEEAHVHTHVNHHEEYGTSFQKFKSVLNDQSKMSFEGKIFVEKQALKTSAYQLNNNLILSNKARAYSKPNLEIFADDVKASHGATFGKLNEEEIFYLTAKGLSREAAKQLLIDGFLKEIVDQTKRASYAEAR